MLLFSRHVLVSAVILLLSAALPAQNLKTNKGRDFWMGVMENYALPTSYSIYISTEKANTITISVPKIAGYSETHTLGANRDTVIRFSNVSVLKIFQLHTTGSELIQNKGIHITATEPVSVYALNNAPNSSDATTIIPTENLLKNGIYYINTFRGEAQSAGSVLNSECLIVATEDNTQISYTPSVNTVGGRLAGGTYNAILNAGQVFQIQAQDSSNLTGTKVWVSNGCKKIAVFQGAKCSQVYYGGGCNGCDHLYSQAWPAGIWGKTFITHPFADMPNGYMFQVVASENNTNVVVDGALKATLNSGQAYLEDVGTQVSRCIVTDKPASTVQFMKSGKCNGNTRNLGNPSLMNVIPVEKMVNGVNVVTPTTVNVNNELYIGVVLRNNAKKLLKINGTAADTTKFGPVSACGKYTSAAFKVIKGTYKIACDSPFAAYQYGHGNSESYAFDAGAAYDNLSYNFSIFPENGKTCDSSETFTFNAYGDSLKSYNWDYGDGSTGTGALVNKVYNKTGTFTVRFFTTLNSSVCKEDTITKSVSVYRSPGIDIGKDSTLCIGNTFALNPLASSKLSFLWHTGSTSRIYNTNKTEAIRLTVTDSNLCQGSDTLQVKFIDCDSLSLKIPNVFTPGTDEINDFFNFKFSGYNHFEGHIYNRWGQVVYTFNYPETDFWNGNLNNRQGSPCPDGTYYYMVTATREGTDKKKTSSGIVTLIWGK